MQTKQLAGVGFRSLAAAIINRAMLDAKGQVETQSGSKTRPGRIRHAAKVWLTDRHYLGEREFLGELAGVSEQDIQRAFHRVT